MSVEQPQMVEKDVTKNEGEKTAEDGGEKAAAEGAGKKDDGSVTVVLKLDLHCKGCAKKVRRSIGHMDGVEKVKADCPAKKLTVMGNVDPALLRELVESKTKKKVELISPQPKMDAASGDAAAAAAGGDKKAEEKPEKKSEENKTDDSKKPADQAALNTVVMKTKLHCDGCANKMKRIILKNFDGVESVTTDLGKDLITVTGSMDVEGLVTYLKEKLKRGVEILPAPNREKEGESGGGGERKKGGGEEAKTEVNKMEHHGYDPDTHYVMPTPMPMYIHNQSYGNHDYGAPMYHHHHQGYMVQYTQGPPPPPPTILNMDDQMFSDENPNGCFLM